MALTNPPQNGLASGNSVQYQPPSNGNGSRYGNQPGLQDYINKRIATMKKFYEDQAKAGASYSGHAQTFVDDMTGETLQEREGCQTYQSDMINFITGQRGTYTVCRDGGGRILNDPYMGKPSEKPIPPPSTTPPVTTTPPSTTPPPTSTPGNNEPVDTIGDLISSIFADSDTGGFTQQYPVITPEYSESRSSSGGFSPMVAVIIMAVAVGGYFIYKRFYGK